MPFAGFDDWDDCMMTMMDEEGHDQESAESICGALEAEAKADGGNVEALREALEQGAGLIADVGVDLVSGVDVPAVDSKWVMTKDADDGHDFRADSPILLSKDDGEDARIAYAAAMIPREPDKEGDVVATPTVEKAAHNFLKSNDAGVDTDHSLIDGEGDVVESWVLKDERTFDLPGGETETYGAGTWMVGIEWGQEAWERIKEGELTGLSIYGMAEHVTLKSAETCPECGTAHSASKSQTGDTPKGDRAETGDMAQDTAGESDTGDTADDGPTIGEVASSVDDLAESVESVKEAVETDKDGEQEAAATIAEAYDDVRPGDVLDIVEVAASRGVEAVLEAAENAEASADEEAKEDDEEEDDDDDDEEMEESAEKRADDANLEKGGDGRQTAAKGIAEDEDSGTGLSYRALAERGD